MGLWVTKRCWEKEDLNFAGQREAGEEEGSGKVRSSNIIQTSNIEGIMYNS